MSLFSKLFGLDKKEGSYAFRLEKAKKLHGQPIRYVTENRNGNEDVIGRGGSLAIHGENFLVDSSGDTLFSCPVKDLDASDLMSGDGVILTGPNNLEGGKIRKITVHFVYYRK